MHLKWWMLKVLIKSSTQPTGACFAQRRHPVIVWTLISDASAVPDLSLPHGGPEICEGHNLLAQTWAPQLPMFRRAVGGMRPKRHALTPPMQYHKPKKQNSSLTLWICEFVTVRCVGYSLLFFCLLCLLHCVCHLWIYSCVNLSYLLAVWSKLRSTLRFDRSVFKHVHSCLCLLF